MGKIKLFFTAWIGLAYFIIIKNTFEDFSYALMPTLLS